MFNVVIYEKNMMDDTYINSNYKEFKSVAHTLDLCWKIFLEPRPPFVPIIT
jgi:hypothetical protein